MNRRQVLWFSILTGCLITLEALGATKLMSIQVKQGQVRTSPSYLSKVVATLAYGDQVSIIAEQSGWKQVSLSKTGAKGWIHESALSTKPITLSAGSGDGKQGATGDELALAGKGFNQQVENEYKSRNPEMDFTWVDRMEKFTVSQSEINTFVRKGNLAGGAK